MRIKELRKDLGLSQERLGELLEPSVSQPAISAWEKGREPIPVDRLDDIARALKTSVDELLGDVQYIHTMDEVRGVWRDAVMNDMEIDGDAQIVLAFMSTLATITEGGYAEYSGSIEKVAKMRSMTLDEVRAAWPLAIDSPYVQPVSDAEWHLRLTVPRKRR